MIFHFTSSTNNVERSSIAGNLTRLIARYKGHDLLLLFLLYTKKKRSSVQAV
jgi:hypothetical protein